MPADLSIVHNEAERRFEYRTDAGLARADYRMRGPNVAFVHTEVPDAMEGKGVGTALVEAALAWAREQKLGVIPMCAFFAEYMTRHPETHELVPAEFKEYLDPDFGG